MLQGSTVGLSDRGRRLLQSRHCQALHDPSQKTLRAAMNPNAPSRNDTATPVLGRDSSFHLSFAFGNDKSDYWPRF
jgi:hypothetical protein